MQTIHIQNADHRRKIIAMMIAKGMNTAAIANRIGVPVRTVRTDRLMMSVPNPDEVLKVAPEKFSYPAQGNTYKGYSMEAAARHRVVRKMHAEKRTGVEMAAALGVTKTTISRDMKYLDLPVESDVESKARREQVRALVEEGKDNRTIASELGVSKTTITRDREALGMSSRIVDRNKSIEDRRSKVKELVEGGKTYKNTALELGVPIMTVQRDCEVLGIVSCNSKVVATATAAERRAAVKKLFLKNLSVKEIADEIDASDMTVRRDLRQMGLK